jgi:hypothetical protein
MYICNRSVCVTCDQYRNINHLSIIVLYHHQSIITTCTYDKTLVRMWTRRLCTLQSFKPNRVLTTITATTTSTSSGCCRCMGTSIPVTSPCRTSIVAGEKDAEAFRSFMNHRAGSVLTEDLESYNQDWSVRVNKRKCNSTLKRWMLVPG